MKNLLRKIGIILAGVGLMASCGLAVAPSVSAACDANCTNCSSLEAAKCAAGKTDPDGTTHRDLMETIKKILNAVFVVMGVVAAAFIIIGGVTYATSQGDPSKAAKAKNTILYAIIGLIVSLLAFAIVNFVLDALA